VCLKGNGQLCVKGQIPVAATQFGCNPAIPASRHSVGRVRRVMRLTFEETTKKQLVPAKLLMEQKALLHKTYQKA